VPWAVDRSVQVALDGALVSDLGVVGVHAGAFASSALVEQVPALVERHLEVLEPLAVGV
jgi:hypothetical protein